MIDRIREAVRDVQCGANGQKVLAALLVLTVLSSGITVAQTDGNGAVHDVGVPDTVDTSEVDAYVSKGSTVHLVEMANESYLWNYTGHTGTVWEIENSGGYVYTVSEDGTVRKISEAGTLEWQYDTGSPVDDITVEYNGSYIVATSDEGNLYKITEDGGLSGNLSLSGIDDVDIGPTGDIFVTTGTEVRRYDGETLSQEWSAGKGSTTQAISAESGFVWTFAGGSLLKLDASDGSTLASDPRNDALELAGFPYGSPNEGYVMFGNSANDLILFDGQMNYVDGDSSGFDGQYARGGIDTIGSTQYVLSTGVDSVGLHTAGSSSLTYVSAFSDLNEAQSVAYASAPSQTTTPATSENLTLKHNNYMNYGETQPYTVIYKNETGRYNVTGSATVASNNTSVVAFNSNGTMTSTSNSNVSARVTTNASYTLENGTVINDMSYVTVANATVENLEILPPIYRFSATIGDDTIFFLILAMLAAVVATRFTTAFGGISAYEMVVLMGWFSGWIQFGIMLLTTMTAIFIGLNLAANIDYGAVGSVQNVRR